MLLLLLLTMLMMTMSYDVGSACRRCGAGRGPLALSCLSCRPLVLVLVLALVLALVLVLRLALWVAARLRRLRRSPRSACGRSATHTW